MKKILLIALAMIAMIGQAAADQVNMYDTGTSNAVTTISVVPGGTAVEKDLVVSAFLQDGTTTPVAHSLSHQIAMVNPIAGQTVNDIVIEYRELTPLGLWGLESYGWTQVLPVDGSEKLGIRFSAISTAPVDAEYQIEIADSATGNAYAARLIIDTITVPEFPTIALPVAAILGLAFIFQRRKEEE